MSPELRAGVLFDVDGTLVDTNYLHTLAWARAFRDAKEWAPMNAIHRLVGMGSDQLVPEALGHECPEAVDARSAHYGELIGEARAFPGARELVAAVHDQGLATILATSSPAVELGVLVDELGIEKLLDGRTTADDIHQSKPSPEVFLTAMSEHSLDRRRTLAVGDSIWDIQAAREAGIGCIAVETGGFSRHELDEAGALHVYRDVLELSQQLLSSPISSLLH